MSEQKKYVMTYEGIKKLEDELEFLKTVKRKEITEKIKVTLGYGDLSENSEYDEAKNEQAFVEGRIIQLENMLKNFINLTQEEIMKLESRIEKLDKNAEEYKQNSKTNIFDKTDEQKKHINVLI